MPELSGLILVVGTGLLGTSVGLAARRAGIEVYLSDVNREHIRTASGLGAGVEHHGEPVQLVVVAVPPDHLGEAIIEALRTTHAVVRSEEHTSELQSLMRISYAVFCLKKKN